MMIDLTCPAEVFQVTPPAEEQDCAAVSLYNLSDRVIVAAEVTLRLQNGRGVDLEKVTFERQGLNGRPHTVFRMEIPCRAHPGTETETAVIEKIRFSDGEEWTRDAGRETEYTPNDLPICKALTDLKFVAGETAKGFPEEQEGLWLCVCGRPNPEGAETCARCRQRKETVFARFSRDAVETRTAAGPGIPGNAGGHGAVAAHAGGGTPDFRNAAETAETPDDLPGGFHRDDGGAAALGGAGTLPDAAGIKTAGNIFEREKQRGDRKKNRADSRAGRAAGADDFHGRLVSHLAAELAGTEL